MATLRITQTKSRIGQKEGQQRTLVALGLRRIGQSVDKPDRPEIRGMIAKVSHLVSVNQIEP